jgi:hypothetical protein
MDISIIIIIIIFSVIVISLLLYFSLKYFAKDRTAAVKLKLPIIYLPEKLAIEEEKNNDRKKLNPFDKKRLDFRKARDSLRLVVVNDNSHEYEENIAKLEAIEKLNEIKNKSFYYRYCYDCFNKGNANKVDIEYGVESNNDLFEENEEEEPDLDDENGPSKRFVSQDRLKRQQLRKQLSQKSLTENKLDQFIEEDEYDN